MLKKQTILFHKRFGVCCFACLLILQFFHFSFLLTSPRLGQALISFFIIEILLAVYLFFIRDIPDYCPRWSLLSLAVALFVFIFGLTTLTSVEPYASFWGNVTRMDGFVSILHLGMLFLVFSSLFRNVHEWRFMLRMIVVFAFLVALHAFIFNAHFNPLIFLDIEAESIFENSGLYAMFLLTAIGVTSFLACEENHPRWRIFEIIVLIFLFLSLVFSFQRASLLGLFVGLIALGIYSFFHFKTKFVAWFIAAVFAIGVASGVILFVNRYESVFSYPRVERVLDPSLISGSISIRLVGWHMAWLGFLDRPFFGWGPQNYRIVADTFFDAPVRYIPRQGRFLDKPHNSMLRVLAENGVIGGAAYIVLFAVPIYVLWKNRGHVLKPFSRFILISFFLAYFVQNFFVFDWWNTYFFFFIVLAMISGLYSPPDNRSIVPARYCSKICWFVPLLLVFGMFFFAVKPFYGAYVAAGCGQNGALKPCEHSIKISPFLHFNVANRMLAILLPLIEQGVSYEELPGFDTFARLTLSITRDNAESHYPFGGNYWLYCSTAFSLYMNDYEPDIRDETYAACRKIYELSPHREREIEKIFIEYLDAKPV